MTLEDQNQGYDPNQGFDPNQGGQQGDEWKEVTTSDGKIYYYNRRTRETSWLPPPEGSIIIRPQATQPPQDYVDPSTAWKEARTPDGRYFSFFISVLNEEKINYYLFFHF